MKTAKIEIHPDFIIGQIDRRLFGGFLEHLGRSIYNGIYDPGNVLSDGNGFRLDVIQALKQLNISCVRYPGGNFASGYHWRNGIGNKEDRKPVLDLAWKSYEPNEFGNDEFMKLCKIMEWEPMLTVNLGTG